MAEHTNMSGPHIHGIEADDFLDGATNVNLADVPSPDGMDPMEMMQVVVTLARANVENGVTMGPGAAFAWALCIGVEAERVRAKREDANRR